MPRRARRRTSVDPQPVQEIAIAALIGGPLSIVRKSEEPVDAKAMLDGRNLAPNVWLTRVNAPQSAD
jgi:hypothetical protein